jgi:hypothetical protein
MSVLLLDQVAALLRASFTPAEVAQVRTYGGEFSAGEIDKLSYNCPAILITCLGWEPHHNGKYQSGRLTRKVRMAAFVATKHAERALRMRLAMNLADKLSLVLQAWQPDNSADTPLCSGPLEDAPRCENLYNRAIDKAGQALWLVDWEQTVQAVAPLPVLVDWLAVDIDDTVRRGVVPAAPPAPAPSPAVPALVVKEAIIFPPNP